MAEIDQPLTELCERAWKMLYRLGKKYKTNPRANDGHDDIMSYNFDCWYMRSRNRFLWIEKRLNPTYPLYHINIKTILSVDEEGEIKSLDIAECAIALDRFRQYTILDDLAEVANAPPSSPDDLADITNDA